LAPIVEFSENILWVCQQSQHGIVKSTRRGVSRFGDGFHYRVEQGARPAVLVNGSSPRLCVNQKMVNRSAPELFPVTIMLKEPFIPAQKKIVALST
jgi:hypothetical protein